MKVLQTRKEMASEAKRIRAEGKSLGFVPTMGALHEGHLSLIHRASAANDLVAASIFVNPSQFNNAEDLANYPRMESRDLKMLEENSCDLVFLPSVNEMYPDGLSSVATFDLDELDNRLEGEFRPGHFQGVADIVNRFFELIAPDKAYFGNKDYQQLCVIRHLASVHHPAIEIVGCPTMREPDGLAMSSRNLRLTAEAREQAPVLFETLLFAGKLWNENTPVTTILQQVSERIARHDQLKLEYFSICSAENLEPLSKREGNERAVACLAAYAGEVRLIDNISL